MPASRTPRTLEREDWQRSPSTAIADHRTKQARGRPEGRHAQPFDDGDRRRVALVHLGTPGSGPHIPAMLAECGHIRPILDGLDEIPEPTRVTVVAALNRSLGGTDQLILTCRTEEFVRAIETAREALASAVVIEPCPLKPSVAADYLRRCLPRRPGPAWEQIVEILRSPDTDAAVGEVASTPLGLWLLRTASTTSGADPGALLEVARFPSSATLQAHLFDGVIPATIKKRGHSTDPAQMERWLGFLAHHLAQRTSGTRDFAWWELAADAVGARKLQALTVRSVGLAITLMTILVTGAAVALSNVPKVDPGAPIGPWGYPFVIVLAFAGQIPLGLVMGFFGSLVAMESAQGWSRGAPRRLRLPGRRLLLLVLLPVGALFWLTMELGHLLDLPLPILLAFGITAGWTKWAETPMPERRAGSPLDN